MRTDGQGPEMPQPMRTPKGARGDRTIWRTRFLQGLKTFLWVAPLTVLLWVYAEQEKLDKRENVPVRVEVVAPSPDRFVTLVGPTGGELRQEDLRLDLEGPSSSVSAILDPRSWPLKLSIDDPAPYNGFVPVAERLNISELFTNKAVKVKRAEPSMLRVRVERRISKEIPIAVRPDQKTIANIVEPTKMMVDGPETLFSKSELVIYADVGEFAGKEPGERDAEVPIALYDIRGGEQSGLAMSNPFVTLPQVKSLRVKVPEAKIIDYTLTKTIPLIVQLPAFTLDRDKSKVEIPIVNLPNVKVSGPPDAVAQLRADPPKFQAAAILSLTNDDFKNKVAYKVLGPNDFVMPPGVKVVDPVRVDFTIRDRPDR